MLRTARHLVLPLARALAAALYAGAAAGIAAQPLATPTVVVTPASGATQTAPAPAPPPAGLAPPVTPEGAVGPRTADTQTEAFDIVVRAPDTVRALLERHMELRRYRAVTDLEDAELARLVKLAEADVRNLVGTLGYFSPEVAITREGGAGTRPRIIVRVEPGPATRVAAAAVNFTGDIAASSDPDAAAQRERIQKDWQLPAGRGFTQGAWDDAKTQALRQLVERRYPAGRISYSLADIDAPANAAQLDLRLDSGPPFLLGPMQVAGIQRYDPRLVPRLARLPAGSVYDQKDLNDAQQRLAASGYFDSVYFFVDPQSDPAAAPVQVQVREAQMQKLVLGVGISTDYGPRASVEHTHQRVPGLGWRAVTKLQADRKTPYLASEWTAIPEENGWRWGVLGRISRIDDDTLVTTSQQLRTGRSKSSDHIDRNVYLQYDNSSVHQSSGAPLSDAASGDGSALSANYVWTGRYFDSEPFPSSGNGFGAEAGGGMTLGDMRKPFLRGMLRWLGVRPLDSGRLALRAEGGAVLGATQAPIPSTLLFRSGGDSTVRGYGYRDIGVVQPDGVVGPGRYMALGSVEWQRPILRNGQRTDWESAVFIDAGAVANAVRELEPQAGVGAGVRWRSPIGPLQLDLAYGLKPRKVRLHMNVGFNF
ncbi:autotransporter assembly complex family protein [uncultured Ramlibacter sp.]|uniref:autotransporter assembly complex protein TamA n=1 Tax=uncultured Ramlibacter sp. TaxID=260755 RepID=UPI00260738F4|nr:BamA/TamA family outer membrane protein [uncultured Ramlibacter sp.]